MHYIFPVIITLSLLCAASDKTYVDTTGWEQVKKAPPAIEETLQEAIERSKAECKAGKEQSCFDHVSYLDISCSENDQSACFYLALEYDHGNYTRQDHVKALKLYATSCKAGSLSSCYNMAVSYELGEGTKQDKAKAKSIYAKTCDMQHKESCLAYSRMNQKGTK